MRLARAFLAAPAALAIAACASNGVSTVPVNTAFVKISVASPIRHVVFVIQENRSFNDLFMGFPGATTQKYGYDTSGHKIALQPIGLTNSYNPYHSANAFFAACHGQGNLRGTDCKMDGWNKEGDVPGSPHDLQYSYVPESEIEPYWSIARQYVLADRMFASNLDGSFVAHQYVVAAYAGHAVNYPLTSWGCEGGKSDTVATLLKDRKLGPRIPACFDISTIASEADAAGVSWRFYADSISEGSLWSSYQADRRIYRSPDWTEKVLSPPGKFPRDVRRGHLAQITWVTPTWPESDHPSGDPPKGPQWIATIVNAVGESKFWDSTAIFIMWDDWGGFFDPVKPPFEDYDGLGFRVPLLIISPYARRGYVTHLPYETASVLRYIEDNFGLAQLAAADARANDPANDAFDYHQAPRKFKPIAGSLPDEYWMRPELNVPAPRDSDDADEGD